MGKENLKLREYAGGALDQAGVGTACGLSCRVNARLVFALDSEPNLK